jgi:hypothetical protein
MSMSAMEQLGSPLQATLGKGSVTRSSPSAEIGSEVALPPEVTSNATPESARRVDHEAHQHPQLVVGRGPARRQREAGLSPRSTRSLQQPSHFTT